MKKAIALHAWNRPIPRTAAVIAVTALGGDQSSP
jgi:hypothetical protein